MPFVPFDSLFRELARTESRAVERWEDGARVRTHVFRELYCDEAGCDCRRVIMHVFSDDRSEPQPRATLTWGWEGEDFYRRWASFPLSDEDLDELRGPALQRLAPQEDDAPELLELFRELLEDATYRERIRRHYQLFREKVDAEGAPALDLESAPRNRAERRMLERAKRRRR